MEKKCSKKKRKIIILIIVLLLLVGVFLMISWMGREEEQVLIVDKQEEKLDLTKVKEQYYDYVSVVDGGSLYQKVDGEYQVLSVLYGGVELQLDSSYEVVDEYFKLKDNDWYVHYEEVLKLDGLSTLNGEYKYYQNYIVYNENVVLRDKAKLYVNDTKYYEVSGEGSYPIIIKDSDRYGIEYNHQLVYVSSSDVVEVVSSHNTDLGHTDGLSVLNYHYTISGTNENGEKDECRQTICITDTMFDSQMKYLSDNGYYAVSMRDLELFIEGKIQLPEKSVSITIDDGWYVQRSIWILEKYQLLGTLFLIGSLASPSDYTSPYLEVHSHTWDMHTIGHCPSNVGRGGILCLDEDTILEDLRKSRESLNHTTYFCYPFYDYNERAIELLKEAGFTMAFAGEKSDNTVRVGQDKYRIPRYVIVNYTTMDQFIRYVS